MVFLKILWMLMGYLSGALPLAVWTGRLAGHDIQRIGDGNPGATNVIRAAGITWGGLAYILEFSKAAVPVGLAYFAFGWGAAAGWEQWLMAPIAVAPSLGHAFNPFLGGQGGKALATILGTWIGLTLYEMPIVILLALILFFILLDNDGWSVLLTAAVATLYLLLFLPRPLFLVVIGLQIALVIWTHRADLAGPPQLRERWRRTREDPK